MEGGGGDLRLRHWNLLGGGFELLMGITTTTAADRKGKECHELSRDSSAKRNSKPRKGRRRQKKMLPIQRLYDTCREVFAESGTNIIPSPQDIERLRAVLGMLLCVSWAILLCADIIV